MNIDIAPKNELLPNLLAPFREFFSNIYNASYFYSTSMDDSANFFKNV